MTKFDKLPHTRQGVRNLDSIGARAPKRPPHTLCPPHIPSGTWERAPGPAGDFGTLVRRCRACKKVVDTQESER